MAMTEITRRAEKRPRKSVSPRRLPPVKTLSDWRRAARDLLRLEGIEAPATEANLLACHVLDLEAVDLTLDGDRRLSHSERRHLSRLLHRRILRVPLQYLVGKVDFAGICLHVRPGVFIPRPETEGLVERVLRFLEPDPRATVIDVGTGSGAIALALAAARPELVVWATDSSPEAVRQARRNSERLGLGDRVRFSTGDLTLPLQDEHPVFPIRVVVSNPPYIAPEDRAGLAAEIVDHEPHPALFAGEGGTEFIRRLVPRAGEILSRGGLLALEIGEDLGERVRDLLVESSLYDDISIEKDLAGKDRYALAVRE
jgi:release factor glutamine methyltransferase